MWWKELSYAEIMSMHGVEIDDPQYNEDEDYDNYDRDRDVDDDDRDSCPRCGGRGCNWCLMTEW
jgi:hypothetical protein